MSSNKPKLMSKHQLFYNSCYICYINYLVAFKHVRKQMATMLKGWWRWLKKKIENNEKWPHNYFFKHWKQLKEVLQQEERVAKAAQMSRNWTTQKTTNHVGWTSDLGLEEQLVCFNSLFFPATKNHMCFYFILGICFYIYRFLFFLDLCFCILIFFGFFRVCVYAFLGFYFFLGMCFHISIDNLDYL